MITGLIKENQSLFDFEITSDLSHLNPIKLKEKDIVIMYTLFENLNEHQERSLLDFIEGGKGFLGLHSANASFTKNEGYIDMIGSRFLRHPPESTFKVRVSNAHYITLGIDDFEVEDELYISNCAENVNVLFETEYEGKRVPVCYTKSYGLGKVVYLSLGHDEKSILNDSFKRILIRSLSWLRR